MTTITFVREMFFEIKDSNFYKSLLVIPLFILLTWSPDIYGQTVTDPSILDPNYDQEKENLAGMDSESDTFSTFSSMTTESLTSSSLVSSECFIPQDESYTGVPKNDDGSLGPITLPFEYLLYGTAYTQVWINTNGNLTFNGPLSTYSSQGFPISIPMVAPFWADVDTRNGGQIFFKITDHSLIVTWDQVGYYGGYSDPKRNTFQVIITDGSGAGLLPGQNTAFYYQDLEWTTGTASGGSGGFGGTPATVGINKGNGIDYVQMGRFDSYTGNYDGPGDGYDGVNYLDGRCYDTSVMSSDNIPPFASNLPANNKITLNVGETVTITPEFIGPEVGQLVATTVSEMCGVTSNITNGSSSTASITVLGEICNVGLNTITIQATDNGSPQQTTTVEIVVEVINPCSINVDTKNITVLLGIDGTVTLTGEDVNDNSTATCGIASLNLSKTTFDCSDLGPNQVTLTVIDDEGNSSDAPAEITIVDETPPVIAVPDAITRGNDPRICGALIDITPPEATDNCSVGIPEGTRSDDLALDSTYPVGVTTITWSVTDDNGVVADPETQTITVNNTVPDLLAIESPSTPVSVETSFNLSANFIDNNLRSATWYFSSNGDFNDSDLAEFTFDGTISNGSIVDTFNSDPTNLQLKPGVYSVKLLVIDYCDESAQVTHDYMVIYDPNGGFLTGGGWIESPEKAYTEDETLTGRANFGFNAKYKNGNNNVSEVDGNTNFQFKAGNLHFKSSSHEDMSLVISGPKATYKGVGIINGNPESYNFLVTAIDGELTGGTDVDRFRIKIWKDGYVVYDNNIKEGNIADNADPATVIGGGSIVIHKPKGGENNKTQEESIATETFEPVIEIKETMSVAPNPIQTNAIVQFSLNSDANGILSIFDYSGRLVDELFSGAIQADQINEVSFNREGLSSGNYIFQLKIGNGQSFSRIVLIE